MVAYRLAALSILSALLSACTGSLSQLTGLPVVSESSVALPTVPGAARSRYVYVADRTREKLLVYPAYRDDAKPIRILGAAQGIVELEGIAVDRLGNLYVANGAGGNVLEFSSGGTSLVRKYRQGLAHPVNVTVDDKGTLYVVNDNDLYSSGATSAIVEFSNGRAAPSRLLLDPDPRRYPLHGVAIDSHGAVWVSVSQSADNWPLPGANCGSPAANEVYDYIFPTLIVIVPLSENTQVWGVTIDHGTIYASDYCRAVQTYAYHGWEYLGAVPDSGDQPVYQTMSADHLLVIPCAGVNENGYVAVIAPSGAWYKIRRGLRGPIGAAAGP